MCPSHIPPLQMKNIPTSYIACNLVFKVIQSQRSRVEHRRRNGGCTGALCPLLNERFKHWPLHWKNNAKNWWCPSVRSAAGGVANTSQKQMRDKHRILDFSWINLPRSAVWTKTESGTYLAWSSHIQSASILRKNTPPMIPVSSHVPHSDRHRLASRFAAYRPSRSSPHDSRAPGSWPADRARPAPAGRVIGAPRRPTPGVPLAARHVYTTAV